MNLVDKLVIQRAHMALYAALAFGLWQFAWIGKDVFQYSQGMIKTFFGICYIAGSIGWAIWAFWFWKLGQTIKKSGVYSALNDELTHQNQLRAFKNGYVVLILGLLGLIPAVNNLGMNPVYGIRGVITLGIIIPFIFFAISEIKDDQGAN